MTLSQTTQQILDNDKILNNLRSTATDYLITAHRLKANKKTLLNEYSQKIDAKINELLDKFQDYDRQFNNNQK
jgi:hypothetical protein